MYSFPVFISSTCYINSLCTLLSVQLSCSVELSPKLSLFIINPWCACAAKVTVLGLCGCVSVRSISATTSKSKPRKRYQRFIATRQRE